MNIAGRQIGDGAPCFIVAELGINHNGDLDTALQLIDAAVWAGADAVKFQMGDPTKYVNGEFWDQARDTPWGRLPYIEYRSRLELTLGEYTETKNYAESQGVVWFASPLNPEAVPTLETMGAPCYKIASPMLTDATLMGAVQQTGKPMLVSTGMSTSAQIQEATQHLDPQNTVLMHCTSAYPCPPEMVNLRVLEAMKRAMPYVGFSDHTPGVPTSIAAVAMGACVVERHLTLSRAMTAQGWSSDHAASLEPNALATQIRYIRTVEQSMGDGLKRVYPQEHSNRSKFRKGQAA